VEAKIHADGKGLLLRTKDADSFYLLLNRVILKIPAWRWNPWRRRMTT
jgi:hypothetical protein